MKFDATQHKGHSVYGLSMEPYAGTLDCRESGEWWVGENRSDNEMVLVRLDGCDTCGVKFESEGDGDDPDRDAVRVPES